MGAAQPGQGHGFRRLLRQAVGDRRAVRTGNVAFLDSQATMSYLRHRLGFKLWMVTRTEGEDWIVLFADDAGYGIKPGQAFRWTDTVCSRMVLGHGPNIAPALVDVPAYADAPLVRELGVGAYIGVPLHRTDGSLFGTLVGLDPQARPPDIREELDTVTLLADLLSAVLNAELNAGDALRQFLDLIASPTPHIHPNTGALISPERAKDGWLARRSACSTRATWWCRPRARPTSASRPPTLPSLRGKWTAGISYRCWMASSPATASARRSPSAAAAP